MNKVTRQVLHPPFPLLSMANFLPYATLFSAFHLEDGGDGFSDPGFLSIVLQVECRREKQPYLCGGLSSNPPPSPRLVVVILAAGIRMIWLRSMVASLLTCHLRRRVSAASLEVATPFASLPVVPPQQRSLHEV
jgi:hypothetical protein